MTLIKSISGIRGTIGGQPGENLTPLDALQFAAAYGSWIKELNKNQSCTVVIGRDARPSGPMIANIVSATLQGMGIDIVDLGVTTTPTVEVAVPMEKAQGGIILTASHNPVEWNALKLLNSKGEFISKAEGELLLQKIEAGHYDFEQVQNLGQISTKDYLDTHVQAVLDLPLVKQEVVAKSGLKVVVDGVNSSGGVYVPAMLKALGVSEVIELYCEPTGNFAHNPEPLKENLTAISDKVKSTGADLGIVVDPDVDRLAFICEDGTMFGEEYTIVAVADYVLQHTPGATVSNLSSSIALRDITEKHGCSYSASAVGEVNVVEQMKATSAIIGGEGNGGVIYPELHYGRDALVGIGLFLTYLAEKKMSMTALKATYPQYTIAKNKMQLTPDLDVDQLLQKFEEHHKENEVDTTDGVKVILDGEWVHLRKSNTEPIIRVYTESKDEASAKALGEKVIASIKEMI